MIFHRFDIKQRTPPYGISRFEKSPQRGSEYSSIRLLPFLGLRADDGVPMRGDQRAINPDGDHTDLTTRLVGNPFNPSRTPRAIQMTAGFRLHLNYDAYLSLSLHKIAPETTTTGPHNPCLAENSPIGPVLYFAIAKTAPPNHPRKNAARGPEWTPGAPHRDRTRPSSTSNLHPNEPPHPTPDRRRRHPRAPPGRAPIMISTPSMNRPVKPPITPGVAADRQPHDTRRPQPHHPTPSRPAAAPQLSRPAIAPPHRLSTRMFTDQRHRSPLSNDHLRYLPTSTANSPPPR